jgi:hypothetical protein
MLLFERERPQELMESSSTRYREICDFFGAAASLRARVLLSWFIRSNEQRNRIAGQLLVLLQTTQLDLKVCRRKAYAAGEPCVVQQKQCYLEC